MKLFALFAAGGYAVGRQYPKVVRTLFATLGILFLTVILSLVAWFFSGGMHPTARTIALLLVSVGIPASLFWWRHRRVVRREARHQAQEAEAWQHRQRHGIPEPVGPTGVAAFIDNPISALNETADNLRGRGRH